ncbi:MAG: glycosyltransferase family 4 protein [Halobacteriota archaeon]
MRVVMLGLWPEKGRISGGVLNRTMNLVREMGRSNEPEVYFVSFSSSQGTLSEGHARIILIKRRRIYYTLPFLAVLRIWLAVRKLKPDAIHVQGGNLSPYLIYAIFLATRAKKVVTYDTCMSKELVARGTIKRASLHHTFQRWLEKQTIKRTDLIFTVTSRLATQIRLLNNSAKEKTVVLPNGVDTHVFNPAVSDEHAREQLKLVKDDFVIFHAKAFEPFNGQAFLIKALSDVRGEIPNAKLVLAGVGPLLREAQMLSAQLGLSEMVIFPGQVPHDQIPSYLAAADVVVVPSISMDTMEEGSSTLLLEALATQKPVIATAVGGNRESITHEETGLLLRDKDPHAIAECILRLHRDRAFADKLGHNARAYVVAERTWAENARRVRVAYERTFQE